MTYREALENGYINGNTSWERGYISRTSNIYEAPVLTAGGSRRGEKYILIPSWKSTQYVKRLYLVEPETK